MKVALNVSESDDSDSSECPNIFTEENIEKIENVLEHEIQELFSESKKYDSCEISVSIVNPEEIRSLNNTYRGINESTDVLSFPMIDLDENLVFPELMLGDIVICPEEVKKLHQELEFNEAMYLMIAHSFLHLLGWDHDTEENQKLMWEQQEIIKNKILEKIKSN